MIADPTRAAVVHEARTWIGTPFHHQARVKGAGVDCLGLVWGTGETCAVMPAVSATDAKPFWRFYGRRPNPSVMRECLAKFLVEIPRDQVQPGDMAWTHWNEVRMPIHMSIFADHPQGGLSVIHAMWDMGVVEHVLADAFNDRIVACWRYPGLVKAEAA